MTIDWTRPPRNPKEVAERLSWYWGHFGIRPKEQAKEETEEAP